MARIAYLSDLTDTQWRLIEKRIPPAKPGERHRSVDLREVMNGILYLVRTDCSWRQMPHDFPPWGTVHYYYWSFRQQGIWQSEERVSPISPPTSSERRGKGVRMIC